MKSMFRRILSMTSLVLLISFVLIGAGVRIEFHRFFLKEKTASLSAQAREVCEIADAFRVFDEDSDIEAFQIGLDYASAINNAETLIADPSGVVRFSSETDSASDLIGKGIPAIYLIPPNADSVFTETGRMDGFFPEEKIFVISAFPEGESSHVDGYAIVYSEPEQIGNLLTKTTNIFLIIALIVLVVAVAASFYVAKKETRPLKALADTAREFGHGNLSARVEGEKGSTAEVHELTVSFNNMAVSLENAERKRREFIANVSHELKTPMTTIAGFMDGMIDGTIPPEEHEKYMRIVSEEVRRLSRLVRNMLEISRIQDRGMPAEKMRKFDICESIGRTLLSFEQKINQKHLYVEVNMPDTGLNVRAEEDSITQVIYNLLDNAVKFCNQNGSLFIQAASNGNKVFVSISNTGPTIDPKELPLVFDRFHKLDKSRSIDRDGAGLGLYLVKTIIVAHGEDVSVTSRDGVTRFSFTLPFCG